MQIDHLMPLSLVFDGRAYKKVSRARVSQARERDELQQQQAAVSKKSQKIGQIDEIIRKAPVARIYDVSHLLATPL